LTVRLLADTEGAVCDKYDVWKDPSKPNPRDRGIKRSTFVIDKTGTIRRARYGVKADGHAEEVVALVRGLD
jgi:peroxiredoxin Q/BCP